MSDHGAYSTDRGPHDPIPSALRACLSVAVAMTSPPARRALPLINPHARSGAGPLNAVRGALVAGDTTPMAWDRPGHGRRARLIGDEKRHVAIAVIRGDGTLNGAAAPRAELRLPLGVLALGAADDFALTLSIPPEPVAAARLICACVPRPVTTGGEIVTTRPAAFAVRPGTRLVHAPADRSRTPATAPEMAPAPAALPLNSASF